MSRCVEHVKTVINTTFLSVLTATRLDRQINDMPHKYCQIKRSRNVGFQTVFVQHLIEKD